MTNKANNCYGFNFDNSYLNLPNLFYSTVKPEHVPEPKLVIFNTMLASDLGLNTKELVEKDGINILSGNILPYESKPIAQAYAGHQYGHFTMLGDGRAVLLGEQITPNKERYDIQLKGSGKTPYSRRGDGKATLGPMLREYIISEAMHSLGIPTTRSLAVVTTGESIVRRAIEKGAVLSRVAASHIRIGTFQYAAQFGTTEDLKKLADYAINRHYPHINNSDNKYLRFYSEVITNQAALVAKWQLVGFIHGVMNTDNITISGETIDYGPCAFMDTYSPSTVFSSIDQYGRYAYGNQPSIAVWGLARLAEAILPLLHNNEQKAVEIAQNTLASYQDTYSSLWSKGMRYKLGLFIEEESDMILISDLLSLMELNNADYTNTFLDLTFNNLKEKDIYQSDEFSKWHTKYKKRLSKQTQSPCQVKELMKKNNPAVIPRNHRVEEALKSTENNDLSVLERLLFVLSNPFAHVKEQQEYQTPPSDGGKTYKTYCGT